MRLAIPNTLAQLLAVVGTSFAVGFAAVGEIEAQVTPTQAARVFEASRTPTTIYRDVAGKVISNEEFVDHRMANYHSNDSAARTVLADGTVEFRLRRIPQEGRFAPEFRFRTSDERLVTSKELKGKVVVLNFWFIACSPCVGEMPQLNHLAAKYEKDPNVVFIALTPDPTETVSKFLTRHKFDYRMATDAQTVLDLFAFSGYPKNIVISKTGEIVYWRSTIRAWDKFESVITAEVEKK